MVRARVINCRLMEATSLAGIASCNRRSLVAVSAGFIVSWAAGENRFSLLGLMYSWQALETFNGR